MDYNKQMKMLFVGTIILSIALIVVNAIESANFPLPEFIIEYEYTRTQEHTAKAQDREAKRVLGDRKININTAPIEDLDLLPGIGEVTARLIIEHREEFGPFISINHLLDVPRIGEKTLEKVKPYVTLVDEPIEINKNIQIK